MSEPAPASGPGDLAGFETVMREHNRMLYRIARAILRDEAEAEDAVQEGYLQAYRALPDFRGDARLSTWLARIVANEALMRLRTRERRAQIVPLQPLGDEPELDAIADQRMEKEPEQAAQRAELRHLLEASIDALAADYRVVFVLRAIEELSVEETAAVLQIPPATVRSRFFRARSLLREALARKIDLAYEDAFDFAGARCDRIVARVLAAIRGQSPIKEPS